MSKEPRKEDVAVGRPFARWAFTKGYDKGVICTPDGMVDVMMQGDETHFHHTRLDMIVDGRLHIWTYPKRYSRRGVVTLASRMARELVQ